MSLASNISPCRCLNDDVLREIFIHCHCIIHSDNSYSDYSRKNISTSIVLNSRYKLSIREHPQLSVSQVCSSWRDIALLTPQLWDNIHIGGLTEANLRTAKEYLSRAGNLPVSISIGQCRREQPCQDWRSQLTVFLSSYRIRNLHLDDIITEKMWCFHLVLPDLPQRSVAGLESLLINSGDFDQELEEKAHIDLNDTRYPKLAVFRIRGASFKISSFNGRSLRKFEAMKISMTVIECWDLLSHCPSLEESRLRITRVNGSVSRPQIHSQHLRVLRLYSESEIPFSTFIEALSLPVLQKLWLMDKAAMWPVAAFQSLAHRSNYFPHLRHFHLADSTGIVDAGILLTSMPSLETISLCPLITTNEVIFDDLALNGLASGSLTPRLRSIEVGSILNIGLFLDMVELRSENAWVSGDGVPARFTGVVLIDNDGSYHDRRRDMRKRGIQVKSLNY